MTTIVAVMQNPFENARSYQVRTYTYNAGFSSETYDT